MTETPRDMRVKDCLRKIQIADHTFSVDRDLSKHRECMLSLQKQYRHVEFAQALILARGGQVI